MFYKSYKLEKLESMGITKRELASIMGIEGITYDGNLPQQWLDEFVDSPFMKIQFPRMKREDIYSIVLSTTFWAYPAGSTFGVPVSGCTEVAVHLPAVGCRWDDEAVA